MDTTKLDAEGYRNYLWAGQHLYGELAFYSNVPSLKEHYAQKAQVMKKQIARIFSHTDDRYLQMMEEDCRSANDLKGALYYSNLRMKQVKPGTHEYAIVAYYRARSASSSIRMRMPSITSLSRLFVMSVRR